MKFLHVLASPNRLDVNNMTIAALEMPLCICLIASGRSQGTPHDLGALRVVARIGNGTNGQTVRWLKAGSADAGSDHAS